MEIHPIFEKCAKMGHYIYAKRTCGMSGEFFCVCCDQCGYAERVGNREEMFEIVEEVERRKNIPRSVLHYSVNFKILSYNSTGDSFGAFDLPRNAHFRSMVLKGDILHLWFEVGGWESEWNSLRFVQEGEFGKTPFPEGAVELFGAIEHNGKFWCIFSTKEV